MSTITTSIATYPIAKFKEFLPPRQLDSDSSSFIGLPEFQNRNGKRKLQGEESDENDDDDSHQESGSSQKSSKVIHVHEYENGAEMMKALANSFKTFEDTTFFGTFDVLNVPEIPDRDRIQLLTQEIWRATGYRFTVKDHPRTKTGHTTRFWCSQDMGRKFRSTSNSGMSKTKYPCRSRLLVSSRDTETPGYRRVTMRMYHRLPHEPYTETQRLWPVGSSLGPIPSWMGSLKQENSMVFQTTTDPIHRYFLDNSSLISSPTKTGRDNGNDSDRVASDEIPDEEVNAERNIQNSEKTPFHSTSAATSAPKPGLNFASSSISSASSFGSSSTHSIPVSALVSPHFIQPVYPNHSIHANPLVTIGQLQSRLTARSSDPGPAHLNRISHLNSGNSTSPRRSSSLSIAPVNFAPISASSSSISTVSTVSVEAFQRTMYTHIRNIRDFCDGLEYQVQFNDFNMLQELEEKGKDFLQYVKVCLEREGRLEVDQDHNQSGTQAQGGDAVDHEIIGVGPQAASNAIDQDESEREGEPEQEQEDSIFRSSCA